MIPILIETACRSLFPGLSVAIVRRVLPIRNLFAQKPDYGLVRIVSPAYPMTLLEELQATIQAKSGSGSIRRPIAAPVPTTADRPQTEKSPTLTPGVREPASSNTQPASGEAQHVADPARAGEIGVRTWLAECPRALRVGDIRIGATS